MSTSFNPGGKAMGDEDSSTQSSRTNSLLAALAKAQKSAPPALAAETPKSSKSNEKKVSDKKGKSLANKKINPNCTPNKKINPNCTPNKKESVSVLNECRSSQKKSVGARIRDQPPIENKRIRHYSNSAAGTRPGPSKIIVQRIPTDVLEDVYFRFIENMPDDEIKSSRIRICFVVELAHWFYVDFFCKQEERADCPNIGMRDFARQLFNHFPELAEWAEQVDEIIDEWRMYKSSVPTYGAILLDSSLDHVLLVQGYYASKNSWGFPKGKINEDEDPWQCAVREVMEETGYDFSEASPGNEPKIQKFINDTMVRLYIVKDVPVDFPFSPHARNEIRKIQWFNVWDLPADRLEQPKIGTNNNFYMVIPFVKELHSYISKEKVRRQKAASKNQIRPKMESQTSYQLGAVTSIPQSEQQFSSSSLQAFFNNLLPPASQGTVQGSFKMKIPNKDLPKLGEFTVGPPPLQFETSSDSHFRPVDGSTTLGTNDILNLLSSSVAKVNNPPLVTVPLPVQPKPSIPLNKPVYTAPKEKLPRAGKIVCSETSAFTAITSNKTGSVLQTQQQVQAQQCVLPASITEIEQELQRVLFSGSSRSRSNVKSSATDMSTELAVPVNNVQLSVLGTVSNLISPSKAWETFKLDTNAILDGTSEGLFSGSRNYHH